ncbi:MAG: T9SS type A sorting domain-containing protein [Flavobacteriales bacterium]|nr:T9SS type A sorting domain-containing protein [Flavobacteriales bacterium]
MLLSLVAMVAFSLYTNAQFTNVAATAGLDRGGAKDGGMAWADFNNDGCLDLLMNTNNSSGDSRLYQSDCGSPPAFMDVTATLAPDLLSETCERSAVWGDFNNDGYIDFARNKAYKVEIYENQGPGAATPWSFNLVGEVTSLSGGLNVEGMAWMDYNGDGFLDLGLENHNYGFDLLLNPGDCTANFYHATPNADPLGLPTSATDGDYMATCDYNNDGWVDVLARKRDQLDLYRNDGGTFTQMQDIDQASNSKKGGVVFCDFDNDGDFDLYWSSNGTNQIWEQTGLNSGTFVATGEPESSSGVSISSNVDGCGCGDLDNDGDYDLVLINNSGTSYIFENASTPSAWSFFQNNNGFNVAGNGEGVALGDYDADGDLDMFVNKNGTANQLWQNATDDDHYLMVDVLLDLKAGFTRYDSGATALLKSADGSVVKAGITDSQTSFGHGCQKPGRMHLGLPDGPNVEYLLEIGYTSIGGSRVEIDTLITPADYTGDVFTVVSSDFGSVSGDGLGCNLLPLGMVDFQATQAEHSIALSWKLAGSDGVSTYQLQHRVENTPWEMIYEDQPVGSGEVQHAHTYLNPVSGIHYFRLMEKDINGEFIVLGTRSVEYRPLHMELQVFPNPIGQELQQVMWSVSGIERDEMLTLEVMTSEGKVIHSQNLLPRDTFLSSRLADHCWAYPGIYLIKVSQGAHFLLERVVVK